MFNYMWLHIVGVGVKPRISSFGQFRNFLLTGCLRHDTWCKKIPAL